MGRKILAQCLAASSCNASQFPHFYLLCSSFLCCFSCCRFSLSSNFVCWIKPASVGFRTQLNPYIAYLILSYVRSRAVQLLPADPTTERLELVFAVISCLWQMCSTT